MENLTIKEAAEKAADYMFHFMDEQGAEFEDCIDAAKNIYIHFTNDENVDIESVLGFD